MENQIVVQKTKLPGVLLFKRAAFEDHRGSYEPLWNIIDYENIIQQKCHVKLSFKEDDIAVSTRGVLRGIHGDDRTWKLVTCLKGKYYIIVACYEEASPNCFDWESFVLSDSNKLQLLIPPHYGHGYCVMSEEAIFHYKQSCVYQGMEKQFTIRYDDSRFGFWWPIQNPILSERDSKERTV